MLPLLNRLFGGKISMVALSAGVAAYERGDRATARRMIAIAAQAAPKDVSLLEHAAQAASRAGDQGTMIEMLSNILRLHPERTDLQLRAALAQCDLGDERGAAQRCEEAIVASGDQDPGTQLMHLLARLRMPGPVSYDLLASIQNWLRPKTYVEIGVEEGNSIVLAPPQTRAIGIDPKPLIDRVLPADTSIYAETSDDFFVRRDLRALLGGAPVDLALIDGMHLFEFVLRDFMNLERYCTPGGTILIDDCCPIDSRSADRVRKSVFWTGDVWRIIPALKKYRPDLRIHTIACAPTGLCVVRGLDPSSRVIADNLDAIVKEFLAVNYSAVEADRSGFLNMFPNDWERIKGILQ